VPCRNQHFSESSIVVPALTIPQIAIPELTLVRDMPLETLTAVRDLIRNRAEQQTSVAELIRTIGQIAAKQEAAVLANQLLSIQSVAGNDPYPTVEDVLSGITSGLQNLDGLGWSSAELEAWLLRCPLLADMAQSHAVRLIARAMDLRAEAGAILQHCRIVTDVRPIFADNDGANGQLDIAAAFVINTIRLTFISNGESQETYLQADEATIRRISLACDRAIAKSESVRTRFSAAGIPVIDLSTGTNNES
jgi:hypothetical protein